MEQLHEFVAAWGVFVAAVYVFMIGDYWYYKLNVKKKWKLFKDVMTEE